MSFEKEVNREKSVGINEEVTNIDPNEVTKNIEYYECFTDEKHSKLQNISHERCTSNGEFESFNGQL